MISDAFNFKAYRLMFGKLSKMDEITREALDAAALDGVIALFDGSPLTEDALRRGHGIDKVELMKACDKVISWYLSVKPRPNNARMVGTLPDDPILHLYNTLLRHHLPSELDKQDPQLMFDVMAVKSGDAVSADNIPDAYKVFYGL